MKTLKRWLLSGLSPMREWYRRTCLVSPADIRLFAPFFRRNAPEGRLTIIDGDWDLDLPETLSHPRIAAHYTGLGELLAHSGDPLQTRYYQALAENRKLRNWGFKSAEEEVANYARLCRDIRERGYLGQERLGDWVPERLRSIKRRKRSEVEIAITRAGDLVLLCGKHRLSIALHLGIPRIPVQVRVRHLRWVETRNAFLRPGSPESGDVRLARHPDFEDTRPIDFDPGSVLTVGRCPEDSR